MEVSDALNLTLRTIRKGNIPVCVIGEIALNYYNVPRVVHVSLLQLLRDSSFLTGL